MQNGCSGETDPSLARVGRRYSEELGGVRKWELSRKGSENERLHDSFEIISSEREGVKEGVGRSPLKGNWGEVSNRMESGM